jgi:trigger factor
LATETKNETKREIQVEVPADVVAREMEATLLKYQKVARLPGFRRGKVPVSVLKQRFAEDIKTELIEALVPKYFRKEADRQGLAPVSQPRVTDLQLTDGAPLRFKASFEVLPQVEIVGYQELRPEKPDTSVSDAEVETALDRLREQHATYSAVEEDRGLEDGDFAQVELNGMPKNGAVAPPATSPANKKDKGKDKDAASPIHLDEVLVQVGGEDTLKEFSENLRGAKANEQRTFDVTYAEDFSDRRLAGKTFVYTLAVKAIKRKQLPELTDDFAKEVGAEFQTVDDLRKRVRDNMEAEKQHAAEHEAKEKMVDELVRRNEFPVPESLVEHQIDVRLERGLRALAAQGMRTEDMRKMDFPRLRAGQREAALREVKTSLILERIADAEHIEVSDEELDKEIEAVALQSKQPVEAVKARLTHDGALDRIRSRIRSEKTLDYLYSRPA